MNTAVSLPAERADHWRIVGQSVTRPNFMVSETEEEGPTVPATLVREIYNPHVKIFEVRVWTPGDNLVLFFCVQYRADGRPHAVRNMKYLTRRASQTVQFRGLSDSTLLNLFGLA